MSGRGAVPPLLAIGIGIFTGYYIFNPALQEREIEKMKQQDMKEQGDLGPNMVEVPIPQAQRPRMTAPTTASKPIEEAPLASEPSQRPELASQTTSSGTWWPFGKKQSQED